MTVGVGRRKISPVLLALCIAGLVRSATATLYTYDFIVNVENSYDGLELYYVKLDGVLPSVDQFTIHGDYIRRQCVAYT